MSPLTRPDCFSVLIFEEAFFKTCKKQKAFSAKLYSTNFELRGAAGETSSFYLLLRNTKRNSEVSKVAACVEITDFKFNQALTGSSSPEVDMMILLSQQSKDFHTVVSERESRSTDDKFVSPRFGR